MYKCPACNSLLEEYNSNNTNLDVCPKCGGIWFVKFQMQEVFSQIRQSIETLLELNNKEVNIEINKRYHCPYCKDMVLARYSLGADSVEFNECTSCGGMWVGNKELQKILRYVAFGRNMSDDYTAADSIIDKVTDFFRSILRI